MNIRAILRYTGKNSNVTHDAPHLAINDLEKTGVCNLNEILNFRIYARYDARGMMKGLEINSIRSLLLKCN